jgi:prepilin-type N-terminal cleavage/methylation domain-containing protein
MTRRGFSLIEILVATVLAAVLMTGVLYMLAGVARDRRTVGGLNAAAAPPGIVSLITWDLSNARSIAVSADRMSTVLVGVGGIDPATLQPNGRLVRVTYQLLPDGKSHNLWRTQEYLDDPVHKEQWRELVAAEAADFSIGSGPTNPTQVPRRVRLRLATKRQNIDQDLWIK